MQYYEIHIKVVPTTEMAQDILCALAGEAGCESFESVNDGIIAYAQQNLFDEESLKNALEFFPMDNVDLSFIVQTAENKNWNQEWENLYFEPIVIGNQCIVHGTNHQTTLHAKYDITINPRLSFGSGHHQTTALMMERLLAMDVKNLNVLDMGCGTCILGILAVMRGGKSLTAIDIDEWSIQNSLDNLKLNNIEHAHVLLGDATLLTGRQFDLILANINRNILLNDMNKYVNSLNAHGTLLLSGFYTEDVKLIVAEGERLGLKFIDITSKDNWACVKMIKS